MNDKLKPCPFCGREALSSAKIWKIDYRLRSYLATISCGECGCCINCDNTLIGIFKNESIESSDKRILKMYEKAQIDVVKKWNGS